jgi:hypothetical protein
MHFWRFFTSQRIDLKFHYQEGQAERKIKEKGMLFITIPYTVPKEKSNSHV